MLTLFQQRIIITLLLAGITSTALAQSAAPSFFGSSSTPSTTTPTPAKPSPSQVWSKDTFSKQVTTLQTKNQAQFEQNLNAKLKPMPTKNSAIIATPPAPAATTTPSTDTSLPAPATTPAPAAATKPSTTTTPNGYTGFTTQPAAGSTTPTKSSSWGVNY